jgi:hypothetical protein
MALAGFDILQEAGGADKALEKTFQNVTPDMDPYWTKGLTSILILVISNIER